MDTRPELELARQRKAVVMSIRRRYASVPIPEGVEQLGAPGPSMGPGVDGETRWYTDKHVPGFLFRVRWEHGGLWLEHLNTDGSWQDDFGLYDYFNGHEMGAVEIAQAQAEELEQVARARHHDQRAPPND